jgi:hypothetical protein
VLERLKINPARPLADDLTLQTAVTSYGGGSTVTSPGLAIDDKAPAGPRSAGNHACPCGGPSPNECHCQSETSLVAPPLIKGGSLLSEQNGRPDFSKMTRAEKLAWNKAERDRVFGK